MPADESRQKVIVLEKREPARCDFCGKHDELRPYGPNGENICFDCGMKDEAMTSRRFAQVVFKEEFDA